MESNPEKNETQDIQPPEIPTAEQQREADELHALKKRDADLRQIAQEMESARRDHEDLKERAKAAKERMDMLAESLKALVLGEVQTEIGELQDDKSQQTIAWTPEQVETRRAAGDVLDLGPGVIEWSALQVAALSHLASTGKPQKVTPVSVFGREYVAVDVCNRIVSLLPILDIEAWDSRAPGVSPRQLPSDDRSAELDALGPHAGMPVRVGRKIRWLAPDSDALLVRMPEESAISGNVEDTEHTPNVDYSLIANRIISAIEFEVEPDRVDYADLVRLLKIDMDIIAAAVKQSDRLAETSEGFIHIVA